MEELEGLIDYEPILPVKAKLMTRQQFVAFTGRIPLEQYEPSEPGYVIYHAERDYTAQYEWLPLETFITTYKKVTSNGA